ncbi:1547_t:CDS:2, partial [Cetraspora pellucida]
LNNPDPVISTAVDRINGQEYNPLDNNRNFRQHVNLSAKLILQKAACVMYLDNALIEYGLYNGSIGILTELIDENTVNLHIYSVFPFVHTITISHALTHHPRYSRKWCDVFDLH